jgi:Probable transposase
MFSRRRFVVGKNIGSLWLTTALISASQPQIFGKSDLVERLGDGTVAIIQFSLKFHYECAYSSLTTCYARIHHNLDIVYYASILFENGTKKPQQSTEGKALGTDLGLTDFAVTSDGSKFNNPRWLKKHEKNLKIKQQLLSRKTKGSSNRNNAARNILDEGLRIISSGTGERAYCPDVRPSSKGRKSSTIRLSAG